MQANKANIASKTANVLESNSIEEILLTKINLMKSLEIKEIMYKCKKEEERKKERKKEIKKEKRKEEIKKEKA